MAKIGSLRAEEEQLWKEFIELVRSRPVVPVVGWYAADVDGSAGVKVVAST